MARGVKGTYRTYICIHCGTIAKYGPSKKNLYCSVQCQQDAKVQKLWENWLAGGECKSLAIQIHSGIGKRIYDYIFEEQQGKCADCGIANWNGNSISLNLRKRDGKKTNTTQSNLDLVCDMCSPHNIVHKTSPQTIIRIRREASAISENG